LEFLTLDPDPDPRVFSSFDPDPDPRNLKFETRTRVFDFFGPGTSLFSKQESSWLIFFALKLGVTSNQEKNFNSKALKFWRTKKWASNYSIRVMFKKLKDVLLHFKLNENLFLKLSFSVPERLRQMWYSREGNPKFITIFRSKNASNICI